MEASALQAPAAIARARVARASAASPAVRRPARALFRAGHDEAFRVIHDRYRQRLFAYTRQMLPARQDAEDALQDVFVRAYAGLRASQSELVLRAWLYRVAHNRCIDELRRPTPPPPEFSRWSRPPLDDPIAAADQREALRRLMADVRRLPEQQRSALLMRELGGMSYADVAAALGVTVPAVKSLLVRARIGAGAGVRGARHRLLGDPRGADPRARSRRPCQRHRAPPHARLQRVPALPSRAARRQPAVRGDGADAGPARRAGQGARVRWERWRGRRWRSGRWSRGHRRARLSGRVRRWRRPRGHADRGGGGDRWRRCRDPAPGVGQPGRAPPSPRQARGVGAAGPTPTDQLHGASG